MGANEGGRSFIPPRDSGEGGPRTCAVEGASAATLAALLTPPPPCSAWFPSPAFAGEDKTISFSRRYARPRDAVQPHDPEKWLPVFGQDHAQKTVNNSPLMWSST